MLLYYYYVYFVCVCGGVPHATPRGDVEVREQLVGIGSLFSRCEAHGIELQSPELAASAFTL